MRRRCRRTDIASGSIRAPSLLDDVEHHRVSRGPDPPPGITAKRAPPQLNAQSREEGQALQVVPVEVAEQDRATERLTSQQVGDLANPGAGVDDQPGRPVGVTDGDRCRVAAIAAELETRGGGRDRKSTRLNSSHVRISYAVFCLK